jgi:hypothetical protein
MRIVLVAVVVAAALLVAPAQADAARWRGQTEQGRLALVRTNELGNVDLITIRWRARCRRVPGFTSGTDFQPPYDFAGQGRLADGGRYRSPRYRGGIRIRFRTRVRATLSADLRRWRGSFRIHAAVYRRGRRIDTCRLNGLRWSARLRG